MLFEAVDNTKEVQSKISLLLSGLLGSSTSETNKAVGKWNNANLEDDIIQLRNIPRFIDQSCYVPAIAGPLLNNFQTELRQRFKQQSRKFKYADLSSRLLTEWLGSVRSIIQIAQQQRVLPYMISTSSSSKIGYGNCGRGSNPSSSTHQRPTLLPLMFT